MSESGVSVVQSTPPPAAAAAAAAAAASSERSPSDFAVHFSVQLSPGVWHQASTGKSTIMRTS